MRTCAPELSRFRACRPTDAQKAAATALKDTGNTEFAAKKYEASVKSYTSAIALDGTSHVLFSNRSGAHLALDNVDAAIGDAERCIELSPTFVKGYSRLGASLLAARQFKDAEVAFKRGLKIDPTNAQLLAGVSSAQQAAARAGEEDDSDEETVAERFSRLSAGDDARRQHEANGGSLISPEDDPIIGIDLGTTFRCVVVLRLRAPRLLCVCVAPLA